MKQTLPILIVLLQGLTGCQEEKNETTIQGKITGNIPDIMEYTIPVDGINYFGFEDAVPVNSSGHFQIKVNTDQLCFIELSHGYEFYGTVVAEPGANYTVSVNTEHTDNPIEIEGKDKKGQELYNQLHNRSMLKGHFEEEAGKYRKDTVATRIEQSIRKSEEAEIAPFRELFENKEISQDFYQLVKTDREYFYKGVQGSVGFVNFLFSERQQNALSKDAYTKLWGAVFQSHPVSDLRLLKSPWFYHYAELYLRYNDLIKESTSTETLSELHKQGAIHTHNIENAKKYLSGKQLEYYIAAYLYYQAINKNYEKELISLFDKFKEEYPHSEYSHFIEPEIIPVIGFHKKKNDPLDKNIKFLEGTDNINSLKDAAKELKGKKIYIDVWATWCGPCKKEFKHSAELYEALTSRDVTILYISLDKDEKAEQWKDMVNYYNLKGYHIRANEKLWASLRDLRGSDTFSIPWYILADEDGQVLRKYAGSPSDLEKLKKQLEEN
ncbi:TlpA family protein disulfide reductase [Sinomicrobium pectinilyticum]|uniref:TlpA family protein disulfide reductase n=1 Tax=Sinomicrobium pectinilyticum TaxID=1084421 RepID=A0A3N0E8W4_SINP1|nr:TlpA disulfide reductase family protein [Sinomicrobium pectinilyticum]RNL84286.1 TlpA family protein disulfide reductase [Sinomicrobium pectinilyticum]